MRRSGPLRLCAVRWGWMIAACGYLGGCGADPGVVVIGGGPAGLAAAIEAAATGQVVDLYEARATLGGSALYGDAVTAIPSDAALERLDTLGGTPNAARTRFVKQVKPDVVDWLGAMGQRWRETPNRVESDVQLVAPVGKGESVVTFLIQAAKNAGVHLHTDTRVTGLERTPDGITVHTEPGGDAHASAVVIATGGYAGNLDRVRERLGLDASVPLLRGATSFADGNGIDLGVSAGGVERLPGQVMLYAHGVPDPNNHDAAVMFVDGDRGYALDTTGAAFNDIRSPRGDSGAALLERPGSVAWVIVDQRAIQELQLWSVELRAMVSAKTVAKEVGVHAGDVETMAKRLHVPTEAVQAGRPAPGARADALHPLGDGHLYALPLRLTTAKSLTGLQIDLDGRLLDARGTVIPRLYAAGEAAGFAHPWEAVHIDSTMVSGAILTGRAAGKATAEWRAGTKR